MFTPKPLSGVAGGVEHFAFVERTDRRNLRTQLKNLVSLAQDVATTDLNVRRNRLRQLIEHEDQMFEEEFSNSAKARLQSEIKKPTSTTEKDSEKEAEFRKKKRLQQSMNCCYEVREAVRQRERKEHRICLQEQMLENERKMARQRELDRYWLKVQEINIERADERQRHEECVKEWRRDQICHVLRAQLEEKEDRLEEERKEKAAEVERINNLLREIQLEELNRSQSKNAQKSLEYRKELLDMIDAKRKERQEEQRQAVAEHCQLMSDIAREEKEAGEKMALAKRNHKKALLDYIEYVQRMRKLEADMEKMREDRIEDLRRVDICTKVNIADVTRRKAEVAEKCFAELRQQICEQLERHRLEEIERREDKIIENRFAHPEIPRSVILAKRHQFREELDRQIEEKKIVHAQEEEEYKKKLMRAADDPEYCQELAKEYIRDGFDYLDPHPNWLIFMDPSRQYVRKGEGKKLVPMVDVEKQLRHPPQEPLLPVMTCVPHKPTGPCAKINNGAIKKRSSTTNQPTNDKCIVPCGCSKRWTLPC